MGASVNTAQPDAPHPDSLAGPTEIVVYARPGCPFCLTLRAGLRRSGLADRINIWDDPAAAAFVRSVAGGNETVPTVVVGDVHLVNPSARRVRAVAFPASSPPPKGRRWFSRSVRAGETS